MSDYHHNFIFGKALPGNRTLVIMLETKLEGPSVFSLSLNSFCNPSLPLFSPSHKYLASAVVSYWAGVHMAVAAYWTELGVFPRVRSSFRGPQLELCTDNCRRETHNHTRGWFFPMFPPLDHGWQTSDYLMPHKIVYICVLRCANCSIFQIKQLHVWRKHTTPEPWRWIVTWNVANQEAIWRREAGIKKQSRTALLPGFFLTFFFLSLVLKIVM